MSCASRRVSSSSRATKLSWWRRVSTTSMASIRSSSFCGGGAGEPAPDAGAGGPNVVAGTAVSAIERQGLPLRHEAGDAALAVLDRVADLSRVLGRELAHLVDDLERALLEGDDRVHEAFHRVGADRRTVAGLHGLLANLIADLGQHFEAPRHALLHGVERLRRLLQAEHAGERGFERGQDRVVGREEGDGLRVDALLGVRALQHARHDDLRSVIADRQVVREVLGDLVALLLVLGPAQVLVPDQLEPGTLGRIHALKARYRL